MEIDSGGLLCPSHYIPIDRMAVISNILRQTEEPHTVFVCGFIDRRLFLEDSKQIRWVPKPEKPMIL